MIDIKAKHQEDGIALTVGINGTADELGVETLAIINTVMKELMQASESAHNAVVMTIAKFPQILFGEMCDVRTDNEMEMANLMSKAIIKEGRVN